MRIQPSCRFVSVFIIAVVLLSPVGSAVLGADVGAKAPAIEPADWLNFKGASMDWKDLRGRAILVDRWATWCGPCVASIPHLNEWHEKYFNKGLAIVGVTDEPTSKIRGFIQEKGVKYLIATGVQDVFRNPSIPHAWLISPAGEVVWRGHPMSLKDSAIEEQLKTARVLPEFSLPEDLKRAEAYLNAGEYGKGIDTIERYLKRPKSDDAAAAGKEAVEKVRAYGKDKLEDAKAKAEERDYTYAVSVMTDLAKSFRGTDLGDEAKKQLDEWKRDRDVRVELEAAAILEMARKEIREKDLRAAQGLLLRLTKTSKYEKTRAFELAAEDLKEVEKGIQ